MPSGHHRSPDRRDRDRGKREWKEGRDDSRERSRKYDDNDRHRESNRSDHRSSRDEEYISSSGKKKSRKSDKLERISDDDSFDTAPSGKKSSKRDSRKLSDDEEFLESIVSDQRHGDKTPRHRDYDDVSTRKRKTSVESDRVNVETSTKHNVNEYEAVSDDNDHSLSPEGHSRKESKKKKRRDRSDSRDRKNYHEEKRRSDLMAEGGRRVFIEYDHHDSKKSKKLKYDSKDDLHTKYDNTDDRSHYSSKKRSASPSEKKSKRFKRDEDENRDNREELDESEKRKSRREKAKDFIARQNELNSSGEQNMAIAGEDEKPLGSQWVSITPDEPLAAAKECDVAREHYDPMSPTKDEFKESPKQGELYEGVDLDENSDSFRRRKSSERHNLLSPSRQGTISSRRSREEKMHEKEDGTRERSRSRSLEKMQEEKGSNKVGSNDFYEDLPSISPTDESAFDFENTNPELGRGRSRSRSRHRDRDYKRRYDSSGSKESRKRKYHHHNDMYDESDHRGSSSKQYSKQRSDRSSDDFKINERETSKDRSTSGKHGSSLSPGGTFKMPGSPVDPKSKRRSHRDSNGLPSDDLRHSIDKQKSDEKFERKRRVSEERSRERPSKRCSESRESKDVERVEDDVKDLLDDSSHFVDASRKRDRSPDDREIDVELPPVEPKFSISDLSHKPQQYSWPRPNDERDIGGLENNKRVPLKSKFSAETIMEKYNMNRSGTGSLSLNMDAVNDGQSSSPNVVSVREILEKYNGRATGARADMEIRDKLRKSSASSVSISPSHPLFKNFKNLSRRFLVNSSETL